MYAAATIKPGADAWSDPGARYTGAVYLLYFVTAMFATVFVCPSQTFGNAVNVVGNALYIAVAVRLYFLLRPVDRNLSLVAACFAAAGCVVATLALFHLAPFHVSALVFFGPYCLMLGYLIFRSTFLPQILGVFLMIAGLGWLIFLTPAGAPLKLYFEGAGILGEAALMFWLLVMGVNVPKWQEEARNP